MDKIVISDLPPFDPRKAARALNEHCLRHCHGFYGTRIGGRFFEARVKDGCLEVSDFQRWRRLLPTECAFHDSWGNDIPLR